MEELGFYSKSQVCRMTTFSASTLWRMVNEGEFPQPIRLSVGRIGWSKAEVHEWINEKLARAARNNPTE